MKTKSKALILALCVILLLAGSVFGTMAYLTDTATVENAFTVGDVEITLDEAKVDLMGVEADPEERVYENDYHLLPNHTYAKDPTIHVGEKSEDCYLFVVIKNEIAAIEAATTVADQMLANGWKVVDADAGLYVYAKDSDAKTAVTKSTDVPVFASFKIDGAVDNDTLAPYAGKTIVVTAYAVQKDGFESNTPAEIWAAAFAPANNG